MKELQNKAEGLYARGQISRAAKDYEMALGYYEAAIEADPDYAPAHIAAAEIFRSEGMNLEALGCYACAIQADPGNILYKDEFLHVAQSMKFHALNDAIAAIFIDCIETPGTDIFFAGKLWAGLLEAAPENKIYLELKGENDFPGFCSALEKNPDKGFLTSALFLTGLKRLRVPDLGFEKFLTYFRRCILENYLGRRNDFSPSELQGLAEGLAAYCHSTDYVFALTDEENKDIAALSQKFEAQKSEPLHIAVLACYRPLSSLPGFEDLLMRKSVLPGLIKSQVQDMLRRKDIARHIPRLTDIADEISLKVQAQYEALPYPRWEGYSKTIYNEEIEGRFKNKKVKILNAGAGTGREAVELATVFPKADILAIDLSLSSLAYASQKAQDLGLKNIVFKQADIMALGGVDEQFDFIASSGVLHHMADPLAGWRVLAGRLKKGGVMRIALYSKLARGPISEAREAIRRKNYSADAESVRCFRQECHEFLKPESFAKITASLEFYGLPECVDLLFHAQEHQLTLPQIKSWLQELVLEFLGFQITDEKLMAYRKAFPSDPRALNLDNWAAFEEKHPKTFIGMYRFWCKKEG